MDLHKINEKTQENESKVLLRKARYKVTPARIAVFMLLQKSKNPLSAREIIDEFQAKIDPVTIYRILHAFKSKGIIYQVDLRHNHAHYELSSKKEHHHLMCVACGRIEDVHQCRVQDLYQQILKNAHGFSEIRQHALEFYGVCKLCGKKERESGYLEEKKHKEAPR